MINNNMPQASSHPVWNQMLDADSPVFLPVHNNKSFFDFADADIQAFNGDDVAIAKPVTAAELEEPFLDVGAEELITLDLNGNRFMETSDATPDAVSVILNLGVCENGILLAAAPTSGDEPPQQHNPGSVCAIPTTALEFVTNGDVDMVEIGQADRGQGQGVSFVNGYAEPVAEEDDGSCAFLNANLPAPLGRAASSVRSASTSSSRSTSYPRPPTTPSPFSPGYPYPPSTPSCQSTCSETDFASSSFSGSEAATPDITASLASGLKYLIPVPGSAGGDSPTVTSQMGAATLTALETCSLTPLIKEELKYTIQSRRLAAGKPELVVDVKPPVKVRKVMTAEEKERAGKRKEQNRVAAQRFRQKQKDTADTLTKKCRRIEDSNNKLKSDIKRLAREREELKQLLASHLLVCPKVKVAR